MTICFQTGDLVIYTDHNDEKDICVVLAEGATGYGSELRVIYVVYSLSSAGTFLVYESEIAEIDQK